MNVNCGICDVIVEEDDEGLYCDVCNRWYHNACCDDPLVDDLYCLLNDAPANVKWFCDRCIWETEKWIQNFKVIEGNGIIIDEKIDNIQDTETSPQGQENIVKTVENHNEAQGNTGISLRENRKIKKRGRGRPKKVNVKDNSNKNTLGDCNSNNSKQTEVKIKNEAIDSEDNQNSDSDWTPDNDDKVNEKTEQKLDKKRYSYIKKIKYSPKNSWSYCDLCTKRFLKPEHLAAHKLWHAGDEKPYKCTDCDKAFAKVGTLQTHSLTHSDNRPFICEFCAKGFKIRDALKQHVKEYHSDDKPYQCTTCEYSTAIKSKFNKHMLKHSSEKPFVCDICGKQFSDSRSFKQHIMVHTGEKPHICELCGKQFRAKKTLRVHMMYHNKTKEHFCPECGYGAPTRDKIKSHFVSVHTTETPYECDMCGNRYKTKGNLTKHKKGIRGICQGANGGKFSKHKKISDQYRQIEEKCIFIDQEQEKQRFQIEPLSDQAAQDKYNDATCQQTYLLWSMNRQEGQTVNKFNTG
ncbi:unnamed protein product [Meganyctiphanes norvegica]|uniref:Uncharacterized protein n=1 Tax=Meganyctiphanes norvegica TaxID=48144 RepID=A0AAV2S2S0_MEGNR